MVCKTCNGSVLILKKRNCNKVLVTKLVLRCNNSRCISETSFQSTHKNESRKSCQINIFCALGMRVLRKWRNAAMKLFAILNLVSLVSHVTQAQNTKKLVETSIEFIDSNTEMDTKEVHSIRNCKNDIKSIGVSFDCTWNSKRQ